MPTSNLSKNDTAKRSIVNIMTPLTTWLLKSGIGFPEFSQTLKSIFYTQAIKELNHLEQKQTDSSISLLSGLTRRDVSDFKKSEVIHDHISSSPMNISAKVITLWIQKGWPKRIPFSGDSLSFEALAKEVSQDKRPRAILTELQRLNLVSDISDLIYLNTDSFTPTNDTYLSQELWKDLSKKMLDKAIDCTNQDQGNPEATHRFSLGIYQFNEALKKQD